MGLEFAYTLRYAFNGYFLAYAIITSLYGLIIDVFKKNEQQEMKERDRNIAKFMYISSMVLGIVSFIVVRLF